MMLISFTLNVPLISSWGNREFSSALQKRRIPKYRHSTRCSIANELTNCCVSQGVKPNKIDITTTNTNGRSLIATEDIASTDDI